MNKKGITQNVIVITLLSLIVGGLAYVTLNDEEDCPDSFRLVTYKPLEVADPNFVSRITTGGTGCVLKEEKIQSDFDITSFEKECNKNNKKLVNLDGVVIVGGYNYPGSISGSETYYTDLPFCIKD